MAAAIPEGTSTTNLAKPLHIQRMEHALRLDPLLTYVDSLLQPSPSDLETSTDGDTDLDIGKESNTDKDNNKIYNGIFVSKAERKADKSMLYNFSKVKKGRKWLKNLLLSDTSSDEDDGPVTAEDYQEMLSLHRHHKKCKAQFYQDKELLQYQYYSVGLLSNYDKFYEQQKMVIGPKKKLAKEQKKLEKRLLKAKLKRLKQREGNLDGVPGDGKAKIPQPVGRPPKVKKYTPEQIAAKRRRIWIMIAKKEIPKAQKQKASARKENLACLKKMAKGCQKECRQAALQSQKIMKEASQRARRLSKEMLAYWKRFDKVEKEHRKRAEKEAQEQRKMDLELREMKRQQRKLNFLITQTELYAHFMSKKLTGETESDKEAILRRLEEPEKSSRELLVTGGTLTDIEVDSYDYEEAKNIALLNAEEAYQSHLSRKKLYDADVSRRMFNSSVLSESSFANPSISTAAERPQPSLFEGKLKGYQLKGMNWLANLYDQGINGILADEMGLGKTVQSLAFLSHLAEQHSIWGPFLIIAPASTLHNWQQEVSRFAPRFKVVPYWGNTQDRKVLRTFWNQDLLHTRNASFHVVITSYQLVIQDIKYFQRIKWHYMILDEAQAIKSSSSVRWKVLLSFSCRNRLLLTGTPIQNTMAELWALLHFIMPTLFDSHDEFNEWFSKDIESHVERQSCIDKDQLSRLHMILKPFMLRRVKKDVENELSDKIEILVYCPLTTRQKLLYQAIKNKISIEDLLQSSNASTSSQAQFTASSLMNLVMQFRKVCNHPELFERQEVRSPFFMKIHPYIIPKFIFRNGLLETAIPSKNHLLYNKFYVFTTTNIHHSLFPRHAKESSCHGQSIFSFTRFINMSPHELSCAMLSGLLVRWLAVFLWLKQAYRIFHSQESYGSPHKFCDFLLEPLRTLSPQNLECSPNLRGLVFVTTAGCVYTHRTHTLHYLPETVAHRKIRLRHRYGKTIEASLAKSSGHGSKRTPLSPPGSPNRIPFSPTRKLGSHVNQMQLGEEGFHRHVHRPPKLLHHMPTEIPAFLSKISHKVYAANIPHHCSDRSSAWVQMREQLCGTLAAKQSLMYGTPDLATQVRMSRCCFTSTQAGGFYAVQPKHGYSGVLIPDKETLVTDAGKLYVLDTLLSRLKAEGHRVLIYSQMTRMIDILEEYMWHRKHTYMRLDGSSKISERRDMVADFQTKSDIFVFLLSTRAGGLGINLTAADTVIFYDSDWNPTVDQQAMDRAHRLGQTKQVTVYRLICKGSIEERILQRAKEKSEIQRMVISGGNFRPDVLKPKEVVSLLLDDDEMEKKLRHKQDERKNREVHYKEKDRERKRQQYQLKQRTGRGPGRPPKKRRFEDDRNITTPALPPDGDSNWSLDSTSAVPSPQSVQSAGSDSLGLFGAADESSNDGLVIVDDAHTTFPPVSASPSSTPSKRSTGRPRGRPRGSGTGRRPRGRGSIQKALSAAEAAAAQTAKTAAYAAYGYSFSGATTPSKSGQSSGQSTPTGSSPRGSRSPLMKGGTTAGQTRGSPRGFYTQRSTPT